MVVVNIFFLVIGMIALFLSPATDTPSWEKIFNWSSLFSNIFSIAFSTVFYYYTVNTFYSLWLERKKTVDFFKPIAIALVGLILYYLITHFCFVNEKINVEMSSSGVPKKLTLAIIIFSYTIASCFYMGMALLIGYLTMLRDEKKQRKILEEQKMQLEVEKSQANFNFLKAQINPHFLHNTLNFLYAKSLPYSPELSEGILTLSEIMRYALSEGNAKDGKAPLRDEIEHVRNVIKINQLRFSNQLNVQFRVEGVVNGATIIPFVLITLVENAFKHGDLKSSAYPIEITLQVSDHDLHFYCRNKKKSGPKELSTGIGLDNIRKRLDLAYGEQYLLKISDDAEFYTTDLIIRKL